MQELIAKMKDEFSALSKRVSDLESGTDKIETRGKHGCASLLGEMVGKQVKFTLCDGRSVEGVLVLNQLRCLKIDTPEGELVLNTRFIDSLTVTGDGPPRKKGKGGRR